MRASSRSFSRLGTWFIALGVCSVLVFVVVLVTGGFVIDIGFLRLSAQRWSRPLALALAAWIAAALLCRRQGLADGLAAIAPWFDRHAVAAAVVVSAAAAGTGIAFGTYSAAASDAAAYVSQAELLASGRLVRDEPLVRQVDWPDADWAFSTLGYRPGLDPGTVVPTYPPGLPLVMAAARVGGEWGPFVVVPLFGALAVFCSYALGASLHSRMAGLIAATLLATSPVFLFQLVQPMSDVAATGLWALALLLAMSSQPRDTIAAGMAAGCALTIRPNLLPLALAVAMVVSGGLRDRGASSRVMMHALRNLTFGAMPAVVVLLLLQSHFYGSPLASGHGSFADFFSLSSVWPNVRDYFSRLIHGEGPALCLAGLSALTLIVNRRRVGTTSGLAGAARVAAAVFAALLVCYLPYLVFPDWSYLRYFLPALPIGFVVVGALMCDACATLSRSARGLTILVALTIACAVNVQVAKAEQAFNLRRYEARYRTVGHYLDAVLPSSAVVITEQESASVHHYTHRSVIRWDLLRVDLDEAVSTLESLGRSPVLLVEDWEGPNLRARFPASRLASLDWQPRADIGSDTRVRLFDPGDRGQSSRDVVTDRFASPDASAR